MPEKSAYPRSEKKLIAAAADWCRGARAHFNWSVEDLAKECALAAQWLRFANAIPTIEEIETLESGAARQLPRWLRSARYAVERATLESRDRERWPRPRTWFSYDSTDADAFDCSYPLLFRDEYYFLEDLNSMEEEDRRALRRFTSAWVGPYITRKDAVTRLLADFGVTFERAIADDAEVKLIDDARKLDSWKRNILIALAADKNALRVIGQYIDRMTAAEADIGELIELVSQMDEKARSTVLGVARLASANKT